MNLHIIFYFLIAVSPIVNYTLAQESSFAFNREIVLRHPSSGYSTPDIGISEIYANEKLKTKGPLQVTQIHTYNPLLQPVLAFKVPKENVSLPNYLSEYKESSFDLFVVIGRPIYDSSQPQSLRPHYIVYPDALTKQFRKSEKRKVIVYDGEELKMNTTETIHVHDGVCSPNNLRLNWVNLEKDEQDYMLTSIVETSPSHYAITLHYIPTNAMHDHLTSVLVSTKSFIKDVKSLMSFLQELAFIDDARSTDNIKNSQRFVQKIRGLLV